MTPTNVRPPRFRLAPPKGTEAPPPRPRAAASTHPRIRARRVAIARDLGRRRRRRLIGALAVMCAVVWTGVGLRSSLLDVDRMEVSGSERTPAALVRRTAEVDRGEAMAEVDLGAAARRVEALPWVEDARLTRMWPGTVRVVVRERRALTAVVVPGGWAVLDRTGRVLELVARKPDRLVVVRGARSVSPGQVLGPGDRRVIRTIDRLPSELRNDTERVWGGAQGHELALTDGYHLVVGDGSDLEAKATAAFAVRLSADRDRDGCRIDVRVPAAPVLTRARACA